MIKYIFQSKDGSEFPEITAKNERQAWMRLKEKGKDIDNYTLIDEKHE